MRRLDVGALRPAAHAWTEDREAVRVVSWEAQSRRGSQRGERAAVPVLVVTAQQLGVVQQRASEIL
ncbi:MAG: hypothetical protein DDG58_08425, partial [Ardenticatenia bacterium]